MVKDFIQTIMSKQRFLFLFFLLQRIHGVYSTFSSICNDTLCNGVKISYPFWVEPETKTGNATPNVFCGYKAFGLRCSSDNNTSPILTLSGDTYYVRAINYDSDSITLAGVEISDQPCPRVRRNVTIDNLPLKFQSENSLKLNFYFNCSLQGGFAELPNRISCLDTGLSSNGSYVFEEGIEGAGTDWTKWCEDMVVAPVKETEPRMDNLTEEYTAAIKAGFVLEWDVAAECGGCVKSGGRCGFNSRTEQLVCFCKNSAMLTDGMFCKGGISLRKKIAIAGSSVAATAMVAVLAGMLVYLKYGKRIQGSYIVTRSVSYNHSSRTGVETSEAYYGLPLFEYDELREATNNFDPGKELGDGGFGTVFYGKLGDGRAVAVKRLYENNYKRTAQFMNEVEILARLHHPNLVNLYGCTSRQSHRLLLVYEYIPNGTVADHLHGDLAKPASLPWHVRMNIAVETASALVYLHASDIVHRDVKTNNILLDENFKVKVADFGLSRLFPMNVTHVSTAPQGTPGYVDPEYHQCYQLTDKSDVYSFGVVLMELISSLPAVDIMRHSQEINLSTMAMNKIQSDALHELVDVHLGFESVSETRRMIVAVAELGFRCLQHGKDMRPSMAEVLSTLQDIQKQDGKTDKVVVRENESQSDDVVLLKVGQLTLSPDSVMVKWPSMNPTPNTSA